MRPRCRSSGFTLVEALVAVTLLALLFGALMPVFQQGLAVLRIGDRHSRAVLLAQSVLDSQLAFSTPDEQPQAQEAPTQGTFEDYRWEVIAAPFVPEPAESSSEATKPETDPQESPFELIQISVVVRWPENEVGLQLHTLAIEPAK